MIQIIAADRWFPKKKMPESEQVTNSMPESCHVPPLRNLFKRKTCHNMLTVQITQTFAFAPIHTCPLLKIGDLKQIIPIFEAPLR